MKQFVRFSIVGTLGFITDAGILLALVHLAHLHPLTARVFSFLSANIVTWYCNRHFTFAIHRSHKKIREWFRYVSVTSVGAGINLLVYSVLILKGKGYLSMPIIALAIASIVALLFNFFSSKHFAFTTKTSA